MLCTRKTLLNFGGKVKLSTIYSKIFAQNQHDICKNSKLCIGGNANFLQYEISLEPNWRKFKKFRKNNDILALSREKF